MTTTDTRITAHVEGSEVEEELLQMTNGHGTTEVEEQRRGTLHAHMHIWTIP
jgi:hypothetical protein